MRVLRHFSSDRSPALRQLRVGIAVAQARYQSDAQGMRTQFLDDEGAQLHVGWQRIGPSP